MSTRMQDIQLPFLQLRQIIPIIHMLYFLYFYMFFVGKLVKQRQRVFETPLLGLGLDTSPIVIRDPDFQPVTASPRVSPLHCPTHNSTLTRLVGYFQSTPKVTADDANYDLSQIANSSKLQPQSSLVHCIRFQ